jgi:dolichyl-phosphate beta-glucosyltransferase
MSDRPWIVVPCYNEAERLDRAAFEAEMARRGGPTFLFVDDGSTDGTLRILNSMKDAGGRRCHVLALPRNSGKAEAVRLGLNAALAAGAARVGYWDADLATPLHVIDEFATELDLSPGVDVVMAARVRLLGRQIHRSGVRHVVGRLYGTLASVALRLPVYDTQCGAKLFRASHALTRALGARFTSPWGFDVELLQRLQSVWGDNGASRIVEIPLLEWRDVGKSKVSLSAGGRAFLHLFTLVLRPARAPAAATLPAPPETESAAAEVTERGS